MAAEQIVGDYEREADDVPTDRELAQQTQEKFQFYALSLVFTLLGLSVQTAGFELGRASTIMELVGWASLALCGICFLWKMEWDSSIRMQMARVSEVEAQRHQLVQAQGHGQEAVATPSGAVLPIADLIANHDDVLSKARPRLKELERWDAIKYLVSRIAFVIGLGAILLARSLPHAVDLFGYELL